MKKILTIISTFLVVACSSVPTISHKDTSQFPPINMAKTQLLKESAALNGAIVTDYTLGNSSVTTPRIYAPLQQDRILNSDNLLFEPIYPVTDNVQISTAALPHTLTADSVADQQFFMYRDPVKAALIMQATESVTPTMLQHREVALDMADAVLTLFLEKNPSYRAKFESAAGYAVFDISSFSVLLYIGGYGYGVIFDKENNQAIYTDYFRAGTGLGVGFIDQYVIYVFHNHASISQFVGLGGGLDIGASGTFAAWGKYISFNPWIDTYQIYKNGANFQGNWGGSVYWKSPTTD